MLSLTLNVFSSSLGWSLNSHASGASILGVLYSYIYRTSICSSQLLYELNYDRVNYREKTKQGALAKNSAANRQSIQFLCLSYMSSLPRCSSNLLVLLACLLAADLDERNFRDSWFEALWAFLEVLLQSRDA